LPNLDVILFDCPRCLQNLRVAKDKAGDRIDCPQCNQPLTVPEQSADAGLFDDLFDPAPASKSKSKKDVPAAAVPPTPLPIPPSGSADSGSKLDNTPPKEAASTANDSDDPLANLVIPGPAKEVKQDSDVGKDPFEVDPDAPLKVDGVGDLFSNDDVFGTKCNVCDTRIHVRQKQIGTEVECPICFSKVKVAAPSKENSVRWEKKAKGNPAPKSNPTKSHIAADDELKLSAPIERPKVEIDPAWGLAPVEEDLLAPKPKSAEQFTGGPDSANDAPELIVVDDGVGGKPTKAAAAPNQTKPTKPRKAPEQKPATQQPDSEAAKDFPGFELLELFGSAVEMVKSPGVLIRAAVAVGVMCLGAILMQWISPAYEVNSDSETSMLAGLVKSAQWLVALTVYLLGLAVLWWTSGYLFRDAALGKREVANWSNAGTSEILSTFLLFAFGFFIGGLPMAFLGMLILPLRVLLGPLFLLSAWYNQSPFAIVSVDAFQSASKNTAQWVQFYMFAGGLAGLSFIAGW